MEKILLIAWDIVYEDHFTSLDFFTGTVFKYTLILGMVILGVHGYMAYFTDISRDDYYLFSTLLVEVALYSMALISGSTFIISLLGEIENRR